MSAELKSTLAATWLPPDGYSLLEEQFAEWSVPIPDPLLSSIVVVVDTETQEMAGFICLQSVVHAEPLYVNPDYRAGEVLKLLVEKAQEPFRQSKSGFYVFVPDDKIRGLVEREGMTILPWQIARKSFEEGEP